MFTELTKIINEALNKAADYRYDDFSFLGYDVEEINNAE